MSGCDTRARGNRPHLGRPPPEDAAALLSALPIAVMAFDGEERLVFANPAACGLFSAAYDLIAAGAGAAELFAAIAAWGGCEVAVAAQLDALREPPGETCCRLNDGRMLRLQTAQADGHRLALWTAGACGPTDGTATLPSLRRMLASTDGDGPVERLAAVLRAVLEAISEAVAAVDLNANLIACNARYVELLGIDTAKLVVGQSLDFALDDAWPRFRDFTQFTALGTTVARDPLIPAEGRIDWHDGRVFAVGVHPLIFDGAPVGRVWGWFDVTAREQALTAAETALIESRQAEAAKSAFLATMSHEIRTPLNGIIGMTELLRAAPLDEEHLGYLRVARDCADTLLQLVNDILDYTKFDSGLAALESLPFDPREVADALALRYGPQAAAKGLAFTLDGPPAGSVVLRGDAARVRQILANLIDNAVKFTARGGVSVSVEAEPADDGRVALRFRVADTGIGIAPDLQPRLFDRFTQADSSMTRRFGGAGLGLAIVRQLVRLMDGTVTLTSVPAEGSVFEVTLRLPAYP